MMSLKHVLLFSIFCTTLRTAQAMVAIQEANPFLEYKIIEHNAEGESITREIYSTLLQKFVAVPEYIVAQITVLDGCLSSMQDELLKEKSINVARIQFYNQVAKMRENILTRCNNTPRTKL